MIRIPSAPRPPRSVGGRVGSPSGGCRPLLRKAAAVSAVLACAALAGCFEAEEGGFNDARDVVASVVASIENAPRVAGAQGGWPDTSFGTGVVRAVKARHHNLVVRYVLEVDVLAPKACAGAMESARLGALAISLGGVFHGAAELEPYWANSGKHRSLVIPAVGLCAAQEFPTRIVAVRAGGGVPPGGLGEGQSLR